MIVPKSLTFGEASECLHMLAKDESGLRYAYVMITALDKSEFSFPFPFHKL